MLFKPSTYASLITLASLGTGALAGGQWGGDNQGGNGWSHPKDGTRLFSLLPVHHTHHNGIFELQATGSPPLPLQPPRTGILLHRTSPCSSTPTTTPGSAWTLSAGSSRTGLKSTCEFGDSPRTLTSKLTDGYRFPDTTAQGPQGKTGSSTRGTPRCSSQARTSASTRANGPTTALK